MSERRQGSDPWPVRHGRVADASALVELERAADTRFAAIGLDQVIAAGPAPATAYEAEARLGRLWVVDDAPDRGPARPVGSAAVIVLADGAPHLEQLSVHPDHGRRGIATALVAAVTDWARAEGADRLTLCTYRDIAWNAPFYARLGFEALHDAHLPAPLAALRDHERALGLEPPARLAMRLSLDRG